MNEYGIDQDTLTGFLDEAGKHLGVLNERLLAAEQGQADAAAVAEMFRAAHSLKGAAGFLKLTEIATVTHRLESVLDQVRHGRLAFSPTVIEPLFAAFDLISSLLAGVAAGGEGGAVEVQPVLDRLQAVLAGVPATVGAAPAATAPAPAPAPEATPTPAATAADPHEQHLGRLPDWLRGRLAEEDVCEALVAQAGGEAVLALRFEAGDLLRFSQGPAAALAALAGVVRVRRTLPLVDGPDDLWAPLREYRLGLGVLAFAGPEAVARLSALSLPPGRLWTLDAERGAQGPQALGHDPAASPTRHERLAIKPGMEAHRALFLATTRDTLAELDAALLDLERRSDQGEPLDAAFRHLHSLKGASASMGLDEMARLAHQGESLLAAAREGRARLDGEAMAALFATKDALSACADHVERGEERSPDTAGLDGRLAGRLAALAPGDGLPAWQPAEAELAAARSAAAGRPLWKLRLVLDPFAALPDLRYGMILSNLGRVAQVLSSHPTLTELETGLADPPPLCALVASSASLKDLVEAIACDQVRDWSLDPVAGGEDGRAAASEARSGVPAAAALDTVRVEAARLDHLLNTTGELVIAKARITRQLDALAGLLAGIDLGGLERLAAAAPATGRLGQDLRALRTAQDAAQRARDTVQELHRHTSALQNSVMQARLVPIGPLFQRFHRLVRDLGKERGREVRLVTAGETTELDKKLIDELGDPLTHLLRNAVDHGLETPEEREAAGKPRQGCIRLEAFHRGGMVCLSIRDDGRGLAVERIRAKAVERGLVSAEAAERLRDEEVFPFIFLPGFSTAAQVTSISGRGVGMDIVRSKVAALKGSIDLRSEPGRGCTFTISLPLTLAMIDALLVRLGGDRLALPLDGVREIVEIPADAVHSVEGRGRAILLRGQVISLIDLHQTIGLAPLAGTGSGVVRAVITQGAEALALAVDQVLGDDEIVVKPLGPEFAGVRGISGATVLGDGGLALILDLPALLDRCRARAGGRP